MTKEFLLHLFGYGALIAAVTIASYYVGLQDNSAVAGTMAFATLALARLFHGFNCRSEHFIFKIGLWTNKWSLAAFAAGVLLLGLVLFVPFLEKMFLVSALTMQQVGCIVGFAVLPTICIQTVRLIREI